MPAVWRVGRGVLADKPVKLMGRTWERKRRPSFLPTLGSRGDDEHRCLPLVVCVKWHPTAVLKTSPSLTESRRQGEASKSSVWPRRQQWLPEGPFTGLGGGCLLPGLLRVPRPLLQVGLPSPFFTRTGGEVWRTVQRRTESANVLILGSVKAVVSPSPGLRCLASRTP